MVILGGGAVSYERGTPVVLHPYSPSRGGPTYNSPEVAMGSNLNLTKRS